MFEQQAVDILERISDAFIVLDTGWRYIYLNPSAERILQLERTNVLGRNAFELFPELDQIPLYKRLREAVQQQQPGQEEYYSARAEKWLLAHFYPSTEGISVYFTDNTSQHELLTQHLRSETRIRRLVDSNIIGIVFWTAAGGITDANDVFLDMLGYTREDLQQGRINWRALTPAEYEHLDDAALEDLRTYGSMRQPMEKEYLHKNGSRIPVIIGGASFNAAGSEGVSFVLEISEHKRLERLKDEFISMASHELKTPVTSIKGFTQVLLKRFARQGDEQAVHFLSRMETQLNRLTKLINDLLDLTKMQDGKLEFYDERFDLCELVQEVCADLQPTTRLHIQIEGEPKLPVLGDRERLRQVFANLLSNALKYSPVASRIVVRLRQDGKDAVVSVQDFGIGIAPEHLEHIFERFYRVNDTYEMTFPGLGIGLYVSYDIVRRHGGRIEVQSRKGKGSTFTVHLPLV